MISGQEGSFFCREEARRAPMVPLQYEVRLVKQHACPKAETDVPQLHHVVLPIALRFSNSALGMQKLREFVAQTVNRGFVYLILL